nr:hypothetical protein B0A51_03847 [Rachicladosporium sp. CCFEE 5018]
MSLTICGVLLNLLSFAPQIYGKRGGGDSSDSGGGGGGGGGGDGGGGGGDSGYTGPTTAGCNAAQALQMADLYLMPASYYIGNLTIVHKLTYNSAWHDRGYCWNEDDQSKRYDYDAILAVGPVRDGNDTSEVFWSLQAYPRVQQFSRDPKNEFVRIRSASYGVYESGNMSLRFDYPYVSTDVIDTVPWTESFRDY